MTPAGINPVDTAAGKAIIQCVIGELWQFFQLISGFYIIAGQYNYSYHQKPPHSPPLSAGIITTLVLFGDNRGGIAQNLLWGPKNTKRNHYPAKLCFYMRQHCFKQHSCEQFTNNKFIQPRVILNDAQQRNRIFSYSRETWRHVLFETRSHKTEPRKHLERF